MRSSADVRFRRQLELLPLERLDVPVTVVGAGAVGSFATLTLAKMGLSRITVLDEDRVREHNLPSQFFREQDVGRLKVEALADVVRSFTGAEILPLARRFEGESQEDVGLLEGIVVAAVDSMASREILWSAVSRSVRVELLLDARMGGQVSLLHAVRPGLVGCVRRYEATLHGDEEAVPEPCSARSIAYTVLALAAAIARLVRMHLVGERLPFRVVQDHALGLLEQVA